MSASGGGLTGKGPLPGAPPDGFGVSALALLGLMLGVWLMLWGDLSAANILSGLLVGVGLLLAFPTTGPLMPRVAPRPVPLLRFVAYFFGKLIESNVVLSRATLSRRSNLLTGVIAVPMDGCSDGIVTLIANIVCLTPGTVAVEVTKEPSMLYVHVLQLHDVEAARAEVEHLRELTSSAFGTPIRARHRTTHSEERGPRLSGEERGPRPSGEERGDGS